MPSLIGFLFHFRFHGFWLRLHSSGSVQTCLLNLQPLSRYDRYEFSYSSITWLQKIESNIIVFFFFGDLPITSRWRCNSALSLTPECSSRAHKIAKRSTSHTAVGLAVSVCVTVRCPFVSPYVCLSRRSKAAAMRRWFAAARARAADIYQQRQCSWQCHVESRGARLNIDLFSLDYRPATVS